MKLKFLKLTNVITDLLTWAFAGRRYYRAEKRARTCSYSLRRSAYGCCKAVDCDTCQGYKRYEEPTITATAL